MRSQAGVGVVGGVAFGVVLGGAVGAVAGAWVDSWTGGLVGAYGGIVCGMCVVGGLVGITSRNVDQVDRAEAILTFVFGVCATAGAVTGYWIGTLGIPRITPLVGFFVGLILPGTIAGLVVVKILADRAGPAILLMLLFAPAGAGFGAWLGTLVGAPVLVAVGLIVGSVLGGMVAHSINVAIANAGYGPDDPVSRHHGDHRPW